MFLVYIVIRSFRVKRLVNFSVVSARGRRVCVGRVCVCGGGGGGGESIYF